MAITKWLRELVAVSTPVVLTQNDTIPADWLQVPDGGSVTFIDGSGNQQTFTGLDSKDVFRVGGGFRTIVHSTGRVRVGTGEGPMVPGPKGDQGDQGVQGNPGLLQITQEKITADGSANATLAETVLGILAIDLNVLPWMHMRGVVIANASNYASVTFKLYRAGSVINTWIYSTTPSGTGDIGNGGMPNFPSTFTGHQGDHITYTQTKTGTGVLLPSRSYGFLGVG